MYIEREINLRNQRVLYSDLVDVEMLLGNTHEELEVVDNVLVQQHRSKDKQNKHKWTVFVQFCDENLQRNLHKLIHKVIFELHPTFKGHMREVITRPRKLVQVSGIGYGFFNIPITI